MKKVPCFILARKNSKAIKNKNITSLGGIPLIMHTINYVKKSKLISDIVISTDDPKVAKIAKKNKCFVIFPRPKKLSNDNAPTEVALYHALKIYETKKKKVDIIAYVQVTEPFRPKGILDKCVRKLFKNKKIDSCFAAYSQHKNFWIRKSNELIRISNYNERYMRRQTKKPILREDTGIALATKAKFIKLGERLGKKIACIEYKDPRFNIDINTPEDLRFARKQT